MMRDATYASHACGARGLTIIMIMCGACVIIVERAYYNQRANACFAWVCVARGCGFVCIGACAKAGYVRTCMCGQQPRAPCTDNVLIER